MTDSQGKDKRVLFDNNDLVLHEGFLEINSFGHSFRSVLFCFFFPFFILFFNIYNRYEQNWKLHHVAIRAINQSSLSRIDEMNSNMKKLDRDYDAKSERQQTVEEFYRVNHINQTYDFVSSLLFSNFFFHYCFCFYMGFWKQWQIHKHTSFPFWCENILEKLKKKKKFRTVS